MQDDALDDIIKEAASGHEPAIDERAWEAMRRKLDVHLPQRNHRRRRFLFLLLALAGAGLLYFATRNNGGPAAADKPLAASQGQAVATVPQPAAPTAVPDAPTATNGLAGPIGTATLPPIGNSNGTAATDPNNGALATKPARHNGKQKGRYQLAVRPAAEPLGGGRETATGTAPGTALTDNVTDNPATPDNGMAVTVTPPGTAPAAGIETQGEKVQPGPTDTAAKTPLPSGEDGKQRQPAPTVAGTAKKEKRRNGFGNRFTVLLSGGADMSFVRLNNPGKTTLLYGVGLGYAIGKRLLVRAGIYSMEKIYAADRADYKLSGPAATNPYLTHIDGRCRVYELPVGAVYQFGNGKRHQWLAAVGLASLLMRTEQYEYWYTSGSNTYSRSYGVRNENKHYFSVLSLSGGYQYNVNKRLSFIAEPYVRLPLGGVGLGSVRLHSAGLQLSLAIRPFAR
jgi:hypothetical protein